MGIGRLQVGDEPKERFLAGDVDNEIMTLARKCIRDATKRWAKEHSSGKKSHSQAVYHVPMEIPRYPYHHHHHHHHHHHFIMVIVIIGHKAHGWGARQWEHSAQHITLGRKPLRGKEEKRVKLFHQRKPTANMHRKKKLFHTRVRDKKVEGREDLKNYENAVMRKVQTRSADIECDALESHQFLDWSVDWCVRIC